MKTAAFSTSFAARFLTPLAALALAAAALLLGGCQGAVSTDAAQVVKGDSEAGKLQAVQTIAEGDVLQITFPGATSLNTTTTVRYDGRITMPMVGDVVAAGATPGDLEKRLLELYAGQLVSKEVSVAVAQSSFVVFVNGAVLRPGRVVSTKPMTLVEAIADAGGYDTLKANLRDVTVTRQEGGRVQIYKVDLKAVLEGRDGTVFYLRRSDVVNVPVKFSMF